MNGLYEDYMYHSAVRRKTEFVLEKIKEDIEYNNGNYELVDIFFKGSINHGTMVRESDLDYFAVIAPTKKGFVTDTRRFTRCDTNFELKTEKKEEFGVITKPSKVEYIDIRTFFHKLLYGNPTVIDIVYGKGNRVFKEYLTNGKLSQWLDENASDIRFMYAYPINTIRSYLAMMINNINRVTALKNPKGEIPKENAPKATKLFYQFHKTRSMVMKFLRLHHSAFLSEYAGKEVISQEDVGNFRRLFKMYGRESFDLSIEDANTLSSLLLFKAMSYRTYTENAIVEEEELKRLKENTLFLDKKLSEATISPMELTWLLGILQTSDLSTEDLPARYDRLMKELESASEEDLTKFFNNVHCTGKFLTNKIKNPLLFKSEKPLFTEYDIASLMDWIKEE